MPPRQRPARTATAARDRILSAAVREFSAKGLAGARVETIARSARVAKGLLFHHFGSKEGLWTAALERTYETLRAGQDEAGLQALGPAEGMRRLVRDTFRLFREHPEIVALMREENLYRARHVKASAHIRSLYNALFAAIRRLLEAGRSEGVFRADVDPTSLYIALSGLGYFYCSNRWTLSAAFAGDLFQEERVAAYEAMITDMVVAYLCSGTHAVPPRPEAGNGSAAEQRDAGHAALFSRNSGSP